MNAELVSQRLAPRFRDWYTRLPEAMQTQVDKAWTDSATADGIAHNHPTGIYARLRMVLDAAITMGCPHD